MQSCVIDGNNLCIYHEWVENTNIPMSCLSMMEINADDLRIDMEECMEYGHNGKESIKERSLELNELQGLSTQTLSHYSTPMSTFKDGRSNT